MLKIASYSLHGQRVKVKLKCTCGMGKVFEVQEENKTIYFCNRCRSRKTLDQLKQEASSYWRSRSWIVACDPDQRAHTRIHVNLRIAMAVKESPAAPPHFEFHGHCVILSISGVLLVVEDFQKAYFQEITSTYRHAEITFVETPENFPKLLSGRIVAVRYRPDTLPQCNIAVAFNNLPPTILDLLNRFIERHREGTPPETAL